MNNELVITVGAEATPRLLDRNPATPSTSAAAAALLAELGPIWIDSVQSDRVRDWTTAASSSDLEGSARVAYVCGALALAEDRRADAEMWFVRARFLVDHGDPLLAARLAFELGALHLARGEPEVAQTVLAWAEGLVGREAGEHLADLHHLRALLADACGDYTQAATGFRSAISTWTTALTTATSVYAHCHLAVATVHQDPAASVALSEWALSLVDAERLHPRLGSAIRNVLGYALLCRGELEEARSMLLRAAEEAATYNNARVALYARFNLAIAYELGGETNRARSDLEAIVRDSRLRDVDGLTPWSHIRLGWLSLQQGRGAEAKALLHCELPRVQAQYADALDTLTTLIDLALGEPSNVRGRLARLARRAAVRGDRLTEFVLHMWLAHLEHEGGRPLAGRRALRRARDLARVSDFRLSTNWWAPQLVVSARALAEDADRSFVDRLIAAERQVAITYEPIVVGRDGRVEIGGRTLPMDIWREGRTGSNLLRRLFIAVVRAGDSGVRREDLCDELWPDSDGDRAVRNLYAATHDLRRVLGAIPGARLTTSLGVYRLHFSDNTVIDTERSSCDVRHSVADTSRPDPRELS